MFEILAEWGLFSWVILCVFTILIDTERRIDLPMPADSLPLERIKSVLRLISTSFAVYPVQDTDLLEICLTDTTGEKVCRQRLSIHETAEGIAMTALAMVMALDIEREAVKP